MADPRLVLVGDSTIAIELEEAIDPAIHARVLAIATAARAAGWPGVRDIVPTFRSVAVAFDPLRADPVRIAADLQRMARTAPPVRDEREPIVVPVRYGGDAGPDLESVARWAGLPPEEVIALHSSTTYRVYMMGFVPGFTYLGTVDARIRAPRHGTPRVRVPAGSVGIAGAQTGIYPIETPGGWQIIGHTGISVFDPERAEPFLFHAGDHVRFVRIDGESSRTTA
jgi:KipI family sensor histidine kinase inhibitor